MDKDGNFYYIEKKIIKIIRYEPHVFLTASWGSFECIFIEESVRIKYRSHSPSALYVTAGFNRIYMNANERNTAPSNSHTNENITVCQGVPFFLSLHPSSRSKHVERDGVCSDSEKYHPILYSSYEARSTEINLDCARFTRASWAISSYPTKARAFILFRSGELLARRIQRPISHVMERD